MEVFPSLESYLRLINSYLIEYLEDLVNEYAYIGERISSVSY